MILSLQTPKRSLSKSFLRQRPVRDEFNKFRENLLILLSKIDSAEREENQKTHIRDFLVNTYYKGLYEINTKDNKDLVIHTGKSNKDSVSVIIETKRPGNRNEMITGKDPNSKAFQELVLYYMNERADENNIDVKYCIATNINEWYVFDASVFEKYFYRNKDFLRQYEAWKKGQKVMGDTNLFYNDIAGPFIDGIKDEIPVTYFDLRDYEDVLKSSDPENERSIIPLFKLFSPSHLLRIASADDSNKLDEKFYRELLHIIGLEETKEGSKNIIRRKEKGNRDAGSLIENTISKLNILDSVDRVSDSINYGDSKDEKNFNIALELCITWINRILFLKLLEAQLLYYHSGGKEYKFLNSDKLKDFDEVFSLFHHVLAVPSGEREPDVKKKFELIPYLNSTLFEISSLEKDAINISQLNDSLTLDLTGSTILKEIKKETNSLPALDYLLKFLDAYDFASESSEDIQESSKTLINASVLGKVFEKINGYRDGSIYTPGFITMYMCREAIRPAVTQKFREKYNWNIDSFDDLNNFMADRRSGKDILEFNEVVNSLKICDPAVGSGHFLVSSLNEIIAVKSELGILADETGARLTDHDVSIEQDELVITDKHGDIFEYKVIGDGRGKGFSVRPGIQKFQSVLFHEKQKIIENCLFGVDINQNSVKICRLRLWIELLKNAYYRPPPSPLLGKEGVTTDELETLPNIDINIKCGNSLISRFPLDANLGKYGQNVKEILEQYGKNVREYKNEKNREKKKKIDGLIADLKKDIRTTISRNDPKLIKLNRLKGELDNLENQPELFDVTKKIQKETDAKKKKLRKEITKLYKEVEDIRSNAVYRNAFEWRFEFPEVLNEDGEYEGFDVVIGNPPYVVLSSKNITLNYLSINYLTASGGKVNLYKLFIERGISIQNKYSHLTFIVPNTYLTSGDSIETRKLLLDRTKILEIIEFTESDKVFEGVTQAVTILIFRNFNSDNSPFKITTKKQGKSISLQSDFKLNEKFIFLPSNKVIDKIRKQNIFFKDVAEGFQGEINVSTKKDFFDKVKSDTNLPLIRGNIIGAFKFISEIKEYCRSEIDTRNHYKIERVIFQEVSNQYQRRRIKAHLINPGYFCGHTTNYIFSVNEDISNKYLLALLNSKVVDYYFKYFNTTNHIPIGKIKIIPIPLVSLKLQQPFEEIVNNIYLFKDQNKDTASLEVEIDRMVYELYGLTEEEIRVVEGDLHK